MQELSDSIKRLNLRITGIEGGEEMQAKGICNIFNKMTTEKFPNLEKDITIKNMRKQLNELREDFNKHQSETKDIIKREIYEIKKTTQNIKEESNKDMKNLRKKNQTEILEIKSSF
jgi:uncharacterized membrane-anchored protein YhcB (DUF1043 family)